MAAFRVLRRLCSSAARSKGTRWERLRNSRLGLWCASLLGDYREACREVVVGAWERPLKASAYIGLLAGAWVSYRTNPDDGSFESGLLEMANKLGLLSPWIRSGPSDSHVQGLLQLRNQGRLRYASLGVASVMYRADYDPATGLYEARCSFLSAPWAELPGRVLDVGFAGRWWLLDARMRDYDVNEEEFQHLPPALLATAPPAARETETNEQLHQESWKALEMKAEDIEQAEHEERREGGRIQS
ncbi:hypothetical protein Z043_119249 [Scleropages formosus]|uniref:Translocase of inner mitochondrial membrane 29 n=1 Tax=Scleropages formosus TaxID=113540 RepID=A0A0P7Y9K4_SCLFO|nr:mitochondrial import inner membrane translocase subunit Tim29 [Scleropages formosus]XP_029106459.1 mitochondrial import inner membrane translocase subunit Tim29-like [Scleropages formosus]KPP62558.1 hypothetical protein Z043_119249 [Scleropages formosus]